MLWFVLGWICVALGGLGIILPGLPTTGFFVGAAGCFSRSSPRFERWVLDLPGIGPLVRDYRLGLGMPLSVKKKSARLMWLAIVVSAGFWSIRSGSGS
ncbi:MAG: YbaN family protein [Acidimicrobiales bacterium]